MNELDRLREMRAPLADPDPHRLAALRSQVTERLDRRSRPWTLFPRRTGLRLAMGAAVLAVAAGATALQVIAGHHGGPFTTPDAAAAELLNRAAAAVSAEPDVKVRPDQYLYIEKRGKQIAGPPADELRKPYPDKNGGKWTADNPPYYVDTRTEWWSAPAKDGKTLNRGHTGHPTPFAPGMKLPAHIPDLGTDEELTRQCGGGSPGVPTYDYLSTLPTEPGRLRRELFGHRQSSEMRWELITDILNRGVPSPKVRAALFRVGSTIPGATVAGHVEDASGNRGTAIEFTYHYGAPELKMVGQLVFDPKTYRYLGSRDLLAERYAGLAVGTVWETNAVVKMKAVDELPRLQHGTLSDPGPC